MPELQEVSYIPKAGGEMFVVFSHFPIFKIIKTSKVSNFTLVNA